jgi:hypothetical protein
MTVETKDKASVKQVMADPQLNDYPDPAPAAMLPSRTTIQWI